MKPCIDNSTYLGKDTFTRSINNLQVIRRTFMESTGVKCLHEPNGLMILSVLICGSRSTYIQRNITTEFKEYINLKENE